MKVEEAIEALKKFPPQAKLMAYDQEWGFYNREVEGFVPLWWHYDVPGSYTANQADTDVDVIVGVGVKI
jgi:hypothetical protein